MQPTNNSIDQNAANKKVNTYLLIFACSNEMFNLFNQLKKLAIIQEIIRENCSLFVLYHITNIKYYIKLHIRSPSNNILSDNLDDILKSLYYLIPTHQPFNNRINTNKLQSPLTDTTYSSLFYSIHREIKIQSILTCNKSWNIKSNLIKSYFKLNDYNANYRHINTEKEKNKNQEIDFNIIELMDILAKIIKLNKNNNNNNNSNSSENISKFLNSHSFTVFTLQLDQFLNDIYTTYCADIVDVIFDVNAEILRNHKKNPPKKRQKKKKLIINDFNDNKNDNLNDLNANNNNNNNNNNILWKKKISPKKKKDVILNKNEYKIGMKVEIKTKSNKWICGKIIQINNFGIKVEIYNDINRQYNHMKIKDFSRIKKAKSKGTCNDNNNKTKNKKSKPGSIQSYGFQRGRRKWEKNENDALRAGIIKYKSMLGKTARGHKGIWWTIKNDNQYSTQLKHRTTAMLYDRYRVYVKNNNVP